MKRQAGAEGLGGFGGDATKVRGRLQSGVNVPHDGGIGGALICIGNGDNGGRNRHRVSETNHG